MLKLQVMWKAVEIPNALAKSGRVSITNGKGEYYSPGWMQGRLTEGQTRGKQCGYRCRCTDFGAELGSASEQVVLAVRSTEGGADK